jgi:hypothetical protein
MSLLIGETLDQELLLAEDLRQCKYVGDGDEIEYARFWRVVDVLVFEIPRNWVLVFPFCGLIWKIRKTIKDRLPWKTMSRTWYYTENLWN